MFLKFKNYFLKLKDKIKFYFLLISNPDTKEVGAFPIAAAWAVVWAVAQIGAMIWTADKVAKFVEGDTKFFESIIAAVGVILTEISQGWVELACGALDFTIKGFLTANITGTVTAMAGWALIRDLSNMFIVLGFVVVGIAFAIRIESYGSKKVLTSLIIVALLINFSPLICGIIIDTSNFLVTFLLQSSNPSGMIMEFKDLTKNMITSVIASQGTATNVHVQLGIGVITLFTNLLIIVSFFTYAILLLSRYVMLNILFMFSPLAFVCYVFPFTQQYAKMWWDNFLKWCFIGVIGFFFMWFAASMLKFWETSPEPWGIYHVLIVFVILMAGYKFTKSTSAIGAGMAIGLVAGAAGAVRGKVTGGAKRLGGWGMKKLQGAPDKNQEKLFAGARDRMSEMFGNVQPGYAAQQRKDRATAAEKQVEALRTSSSAGDRQRYEQIVRTGRGALGAAAVNVANQKGDFDRIMGGNLNDKNQRTTYATQFGYERSTFNDKDHRLAGLDDGRVRRDLISTGLTQAQAAAVAPGSAQYILSQQRVVATQLEKNWHGMDQTQRQNIDMLDLTPEFLRKRSNSDLEPFTLLPAGHPTRTHLRNQVTAGALPAAPTLPIEIQLRTAMANGDTSEIRRLTSLRTKLQTM